MSTDPHAGTDAPLTFADLGLDPALLSALDQVGFKTPTPIQAEAIPYLMQGKDIIGGARTGSGKTAAFGLPLLHLLRQGGRTPRALILAPTRELARQVSKALQDFAAGLSVTVLTVYGGVGYQQQLRALKQGVTVVVGTPGRVLDLMEKGALRLDELEVLVLDEADEMLQMGFIEDIERVLAAAPQGRQIALFSATMPPPIKKIANQYLQNPVQVQVESSAMTTSHITQGWLLANFRQKTDALVRLLHAEDRDATLVFARTKKSCDDIAGQLARAGFSVEALHGDMAQAAREEVLAKLRERRVRVVVATDVAARGLDVDHITHVINYDMPHNSEIYVHRIGRTARAGRAGQAITFVASHERGKLRSFQHDLKDKFERIYPPTDAEIDAIQAKRLLLDLGQVIESGQSTQAAAWLERMEGEHEWTQEQLLHAAIVTIARDKGLHLEPQSDARQSRKEKSPKRSSEERQERSDSRQEKRRDVHASPPSSSHEDHDEDRERSAGPPPHDDPKKKPQFSTLNEVELFFPVGRRDGMTPADFIGALCNQASLPAEVIGRVTLGGKQSFVGLPQRVAMELLGSKPTLELRGTAYPLQLSQSKEGAKKPYKKERSSATNDNKKRRTLAKKKKGAARKKK